MPDQVDGGALAPRGAPVLRSGLQHHTSPAALTDAPDAPVGPFVIGVTGASASGKTTVCEKIIHGLGDQRCVLVSLDWFYLGLPEGVDVGSYNFDHPDAFDFDALASTLDAMRTKKPVSVPMYDFAKHRRTPENCVELHGADVIIVEGILTFYDKSLRDRMHMKIFVDEDPDICLARRITRDVRARGRSVESVLAQYITFVKPSFEEFILPTKRHSDLVVPRGGDNLVAIDLIIKHSALKIRQDDLRKVFSNLVVMSDSYQTRGLHTLFRQHDATRDDFVFYSNRLMRLLIEEGLGLLPFARKTVTTPSGHKFQGVAFIAGLAAVSLIPSGEAMEASLRAVCATVRIGKMAITGNQVTYAALPKQLSKRHILMLAPVLDTGSAVETAMTHLQQLGAAEERMLTLSLIASPQAVRRLCRAFPRARVVVSAVDAGVDARGRVFPGAGDFSTRYYGSTTYCAPGEPGA